MSIFAVYLSTGLEGGSACWLATGAVLGIFAPGFTSCACRALAEAGVTTAPALKGVRDSGAAAGTFDNSVGSGPSLSIARNAPAASFAFCSLAAFNSSTSSGVNSISNGAESFGIGAVASAPGPVCARGAVVGISLGIKFDAATSTSASTPEATKIFWLLVRGFFLPLLTGRSPVSPIGAMSSASGFPHRRPCL